MPSATFSLDAAEVAELRKDLGKLGYSATLALGPVVKHFGAVLQTRVKARARKPRSGRPGPRMITGDYNRSISLKTNISLGGYEAVVGTDKPQGRRLEMGFTGTDSLGRQYDQPPYPHFRPAFDVVEPLFQAGIAAVVDRALKESGF